MVKQQDLAARMGRSRATVIRYEGLLRVPDDIQTLYLDALATFTEVAQPTTSAA
jgi:transcriptional regulator with XRE-family HTH domain